MKTRLFGCIEAGGTKFVLGVMRDHETVLHTARIATTTPRKTLDACVAVFAGATAEWGRFDAIGIAAFGPVSVRPSAPDRGMILPTPKAGWSGTDLVAPFRRAFGCPVGLDTDVNAAILAESLWGTAQGLDVATYVTVGTGIGGGLLVDGVMVHGTRHPEMGHILPRRHPDDGDFAGVCPYHGDCLEGLASGPAIAARWGTSLSELPADHPAHDIVAYYLAQLVLAQRALLAPQRIVFGGGVLATRGLIDRIRTQTMHLEQGYFGGEDPTALIVASGLGERTGLLGALALAQAANR